MGASGWLYFTPYQPNPADALATLRQHVYASGDFVNYLAEEKQRLQEILQEGGEAQEKWETKWEGVFGSRRNLAEQLQEVIDLLQQQTIDNLHLMDNGSGTHSILDIRFITDTDENFSANPLASATLHTIFGVPQPTHEQAEIAYRTQSFAPFHWRWTALYFVIYRDGQPDEYCFCGISGD